LPSQQFNYMIIENMPPILKIENVSKNFPGVKALNSIDLEIKQGTVHALVGENGAGKSTLMKILNGNYAFDTGDIFLNGQKVDITNPVRAAELGISIIFQELNSVPNLSVAENIFLGRLHQFSKSSANINWKKINSLAQEALNKVKCKVEPSKLVEKLSISQRQLVEIAKALTYDAKIILMDEPSATLTDKELHTLFAIIKQLRAEGITIIYISHRLEEIFSIADFVTVLRDGEIISHYVTGEVDKDKLISDMVGRDLSQVFPDKDNTPGDTFLGISNIQLKPGDPINSFSIRKGEIFGFAGLVGSGRTELMRAVFAVDNVKSVTINKDQKKLKIRHPENAIKNGIAFLTENRKEEGLILDFSVRLNITMANLKAIIGARLIRKRKEQKVTKALISRLDIRTPSEKTRTEELSGGNQQKVVLGKWLNTQAQILILDEPTRGIDVGAKYEIYKTMIKLASDGKSIIFISSELPELLGLCDRIAVMKNNEIVKILDNQNLSPQDVMQYAI
jgi:ribose transport system ATP-binding protein